MGIQPTGGRQEEDVGGGMVSVGRGGRVAVLGVAWRGAEVGEAITRISACVSVGVGTTGT